MKFFHTGDWHLGKLVHGIHMDEEQKYVLDKLIDKIKIYDPQLIIIAGDIYDRSIPPVSSVELLNEFLNTVVLKMKKKIIMISGNHDSSNRLSFGNKLLEDQGLYIVGEIDKDIKKIVLEDEYGKLNIYPIPYMDVSMGRFIYEDDEIKTHDDLLKKITDNIKSNMNKDERNIVIYHGFVINLNKKEDVEISDSERPLSIGGSDYIDVNYFTDFDYSALGHLHKPQKVLNENIRYSGSLMKYSFSEHNQRKAITLVDLKAKGDLSYELLDLVSRRDLRVIKGNLNDLIDEKIYKNTNVDDYIMAILTDEGEIYDAPSKLKAVYPNLLKIELKRNISDKKIDIDNEDFEKKDILELFKDFYEENTNIEFDENKKNILRDFAKEIKLWGEK
ncbi:MAG: exonuclease SbcCD subunit D [Peptostreptococcaceae bacterium]|nr:exonuclease SbcCD subunit D [Peptostreptococcaceae bacterium]